MFKDKINKLLNKDGENNNKKKIENLVVFIIIIIVTVLIINSIWGSDGKKEISSNTYTQLASNENKSVISNNKLSDEYNLEQDLEDILSKVNGAGKVKVLITYSESSQIVPVSNQSYKQTRNRRK